MEATHGWERILYATVNPDAKLGDELASVLDDLNMSVAEFGERTGISESVLYKFTSGHRTNIQLENFQQIVQAVKRVEQGRDESERVVGVISNRESLEPVRSTRTIDGIEVSLWEYPSSTVEEAIRQSIIAERDGVDAIICGPITAYTIENIVYTPVIGLDITSEQIDRAIETAVEKTVAPS